MLMPANNCPMFTSVYVTSFMHSHNSNEKSLDSCSNIMATNKINHFIKIPSRLGCKI